jgi:16S rRNA (adenine1518-N6/adenine1519-N6)-dimethyltransferase
MPTSNGVYNAIAALPPLRDIIADNDLKATKALGQNFLCDLNLTRKIARQADIQDSDHIIEIGPGPGGLTRGILLEGAKDLTAIEFDSRAVRALHSLVEAADKRLTLIQGDALQENLLRFRENGSRKIIANLPYNIATPLLINWLKNIHEHGADAYQSITVMVQKEVAERIAAPFGSQAYGRLSILCQWLCHCRICFDVPASAFVPPPKVTSSIIQLVPKPRDDKLDFKMMEHITAQAFGQRRKMIRQTLKPYKDILAELNIDETLRAENLTVKNYIAIAKRINF